MKYKKVESILREVWGNNLIDEFNQYSFEFAARESKFIQLRDCCMSDLEYKVAFSRLCRFRREARLRELFDSTNQIKDILKVDYSKISKYVTLQIDYEYMEEAIKTRYFSKKT